MLLPIICSVSARVDIKWGAAAFSCHFSAVFTLPWRPGCFWVNLPGKQGGVRCRGSKCYKGLGCQGGEEGKGQGPEAGQCDRRKIAQSCSVMLCLHLINQPFRKHNLYSSGPTEQTLLHTATPLKFHRNLNLGFRNNHRFLLSTPSTSPPTLSLLPSARGWFWTSECSVLRKELYKGHPYLDSAQPIFLLEHIYFFTKLQIFTFT